MARRKAERIRKEILLSKPAELRSLAKSERKVYKKFEIKMVESMPPKLKAKFKSLEFREKLFVHYYFDSATVTEAAKRCGFTDKEEAYVKGARIKRKCKGILDHIGNEILREVSARTYEKNIITREIIIEKLARMFLPNISDFDDLKEAKRRGLMDAVQEIKYKSVFNESTSKWSSIPERIKLHNPVEVSKQICKMLGYEAPSSKLITKEVNHSVSGKQPKVSLNITLVSSSDALASPRNDKVIEAPEDDE